MNISLSILQFLILVSVSLVVSRIFSAIGNKYFGFPAVIGELITGIIIGPFALGSVPVLGFTLIPHTATGFLAPVSSSVPIPQSFYMFGQVGVIILLFFVGLNTDLQKFVKAIKSSTFIAIGESAFPFMIGYVTVLLLFHNVISALFMGAILTASSTGITARVLADMKKVNSSEGITIMTATVIVDVISITLLALVTGIAYSSLSINSLIVTVLKVLVFWGIALFVGLKLSKYVSKLIALFKDSLTQFAFVLLILFLVVSGSEFLGLTVIVGAYAFGLALSKVPKKEEISKNTENLANFFTPIFFVSMGMIVDMHTLAVGIFISLLILAIAIITKLLGAAFPAKLLGYDFKKSIIIGAGLMSMGEVALIIAGNAILYGLISNEIYSIAIFTTIVTTIIAPILLSKLYKSDKTMINIANQ
ncbi:MAG: cation:proton antiporter [Thermoplasmata archaeon]